MSESAATTAPGDTIRRIATDWLGYKPTPDHLATLEQAVFDAVDALEAERDEAVELACRIKQEEFEREIKLTAQSERLREAMRHVINDSPGTPDTVKKYLLRELEGSWGEPYEEAMLRD
jgi:hypothetical protein